MLAWVNDEDMLAALDPLPDGVRGRVMPGDPAADPEVGEVEMLVAPLDTDRLRAALPVMGSLRAIQVISAGTDWIEALVPAGVALCNARGVRDDAVADWIVAAILFDAQDLGRAERQRLAQEWSPWSPRELAGQRALIVGHGSIGRALARRLAAFGMAITAVAQHARPGVHAIADLPGLLGDADVLVLLAPLTPDTRGLAGRDVLAGLPDGALVVNAGRGALVDTDALVAELRAERLRAALDVTDPEPLPARHPLWDAPGLLLTPHHAGASVQSRATMARLARAQLGRAARGEPLRNVV